MLEPLWVVGHPLWSYNRLCPIDLRLSSAIPLPELWHSGTRGGRREGRWFRRRDGRAAVIVRMEAAPGPDARG